MCVIAYSEHKYASNSFAVVVELLKIVYRNLPIYSSQDIYNLREDIDWLPITSGRSLKCKYRGSKREKLHHLHFLNVPNYTDIQRVWCRWTFSLLIVWQKKLPFKRLCMVSISSSYINISHQLPVIRH